MSAGGVLSAIVIVVVCCSEEGALVAQTNHNRIGLSKPYPN